MIGRQRPAAQVPFYMTPENSHAKRRGIRVALAVGTSLVSKLGTILLQIVALPLAMHALGFKLFGVYAALSAAPAFLHLTGIGVGPGLTRAVAKSQAEGDLDSERSYVFTALVLLTGAGLIAAALVYGLLEGLSATTLFGKEFAPYQEVIHSCVPFLVILVFLDITLGVAERTQAAYQEMHVLNLWGAAGNFLGGALLIFGIHRWPTVLFLMISILGMQALCRTMNGLIMFAGKRRYLLSGRLRFCPKKAKELVSDGLAFTTAQSLAPMLQREGTKLIASHFAGPAGAATIAVINQMHTMLGGFIAMFTAPMWPALMDALHRRDFTWFNTARKRLWAIAGAHSLIVIGVFAVAGMWVMQKWLGDEAHIAHSVLIAFAVCHAMQIWNHVNYILLTALGVIVTPAVVSVIEAVVGLLAGWVAVQWSGVDGLVWSIVLVLAVGSLWIFPMLLQTRLRQFRSQAAVGLPQTEAEITLASNA